MVIVHAGRDTGALIKGVGKGDSGGVESGGKYLGQLKGGKEWLGRKIIRNIIFYNMKFFI